MKWVKIFVPLNIINLIALIIMTQYLPKTVMIYLNVIPIFNFMGPRWMVPIVGILPFVLIASMAMYQNQMKNNEQAQKNKKVENIILPVITLIIAVLPWVSVLMANQKSHGINTLVAAIVGVGLGFCMIVIGNYMGIIKQNKYLGIKTRWTLKSEKVWHKTHRMSACLTVIGGCIMIVFSLASHFVNTIWLFYVGMALSITLIALVPYVYSYFIYQKHTNRS